jgi:hypothetical protein
MPAPYFLVQRNQLDSRLPPHDSLILQLAGHVAAVSLLCHTLEPLHGAGELLQLLLVTITASGALTFLLMVALYAVLVASGSYAAGNVLYAPICGFHAGTAALLVALKQAIPDNDVTLLRLYHCRANDLPGLYIAGMMVVGVGFGTFFSLVPFAVFGTYIAWLYLRYFFFRSDSYLRGDPSEAFRFASFFPAAVQSQVNTFAAFCSASTGFAKLHEASGGSSREGEVPRTAILLGRTSPPRDDDEATRRRLRGSKALDERLGLPIERAASEMSGDGLKAALERRDSANSGGGDSLV